ncbi:MAG: HU family DNA-binding protein [Planctomycetota bacterium]
MIGGQSNANNNKKGFCRPNRGQQFLDEIVSELAKGNRLEFRDFGVFEVREQAARVAQNPKTLEPIEVPAKRRVKFKMGRIMREGMNGKVAGK